MGETVVFKNRLPILRVILVAFIITVCFTMLSSNQIHFSSEPTKIYSVQGKNTFLFLNHDNQEERIGLLSYVKIPLSSWYILYNFYIKKEYRGHGHGKQLFEKVLHELINEDATKVFLNPGPFEEKDGTFSPVYGPEREKLITQLVTFYKKFNFTFVNSKFLSIILKAVYKTVGINEDPRLIMIYKKNKS